MPKRDNGPTTRTGGVGATGKMGKMGKMGKAICVAVAADPELELVAAVRRSRVGSSIESLDGRGGSGVMPSDRIDAPIEPLLGFESDQNLGTPV
jgi:dihydrodipicolinate reductase